MLALVNLFWFICKIGNLSFMDFRFRWQECAYTLKGINPFDSILKNYVDPSIGKIDSVAGTVPWAFLLGNVMVFGFLPYNIAKCCYLFLFLILIILTSYIVMKYSYGDMKHTFFISFCILVSSWGTKSSLLLGNYGAILCMMTIIAIYIRKKHPFISGILLAIASCKPQSIGLVIITMLLLHDFIPVFIAGIIDIASWIIVSVYTQSSPISLIRDIFRQGIGYGGVQINNGIFTILRNFGISNIVILFLGMILGISLTIYFARKIKDKSQNETLAFIPALLLQTVWFYSHPYDLVTVSFVVIFIIKYFYNWPLLPIFTLHTVYGTFIWERLFSNILVFCGMENQLAADISFLVEDLIYILFTVSFVFLIRKGSNNEKLQ